MQQAVLFVEKLHPNLIPYIRDGMIHHPLLLVPLDWGASNINQRYRSNLDAVLKAEADGDWKRYVRLYERPYRLDALLSATRKGLEKIPSKFWEVVGEVWQDSENIRQNPSKWKRLWGKAIEGRHRSDSCRRCLLVINIAQKFTLSKIINGGCGVLRTSKESRP